MHDYKSLPPPIEHFSQPEDAHLHRLQDEVLRKVRARQTEPKVLFEHAGWFTPARQMGMALVLVLGLVFGVWPSTQRVSTPLNEPRQANTSQLADPEQALESLWAAQLPTAPEIAPLAEAYFDNWQYLELAETDNGHFTQNQSLSPKDAEAIEAYLMESSPLEQLQAFL